MGTVLSVSGLSQHRGALTNQQALKANQDLLSRPEASPYQSIIPGQYFKSQVKFSGSQAPDVDAEINRFANRHHVQLDPFQKDAMSKLLAGHSVLVAAPTGSGKTLVGNFALEQALNHHKRAFYTTPRKAISGQKFKDFQALYGENQVGLMTGDITIHPDAPIIVMTTEVLRNMQYQDPARLNNVSSVVFDECHFVNDFERGPVWEECIMNMPPSVQQVHLSATVGNAKQYTDWIQRISTQQVTDAISSDKRPVNLVYLFFNPRKNRLEPVFDDGFTHKSVNPDFESAFSHDAPYHPRNLMQALKSYRPGSTAEKELLNSEPSQEVTHASPLFPAVMTRFNRRFCNTSFHDQATQNDSESLLRWDTDGGKARRRKIKALIDEYKRIDPDLVALNPNLEEGLYRGYGVHHSGMTYAERGLVEQGLIRGLLEFVWGTDTIGAGMNMPERAAIISQFEKFDGREMGPITASDFQQICGRAGRRGLDKIGYVVLVPPEKSDFDLPDRILSYINQPPEDLISKFEPTPTMVLSILRGHSIEDAKQLMSRNFAVYQDPSLAKAFKKQLMAIIQFLGAQGLLTLQRDAGGQVVSAKPTPLGEDMMQVPDNAFLSVLALLKSTYPKSLETFSDAQIAAFLGSFMDEKGDDFHLPRNRDNGLSSLQDYAQAFNETYYQLSDQATQSGITGQTMPSSTFMPFIYQWVQSHGQWPQLRRAIESTQHQGVGPSKIYIGEFMNTVRRTANLVDKLSEMTNAFSPTFRQRLKRIQTNALLSPPIRAQLE